MNKKIALYVLVAAVAGAGIGAGVFMFLNNNIPCYERSGADIIKTDHISAGDTVSSPLYVSGEARGCWYFEASFPVRMLDANGKELGVAVAQAKDEWMTEEFVPFLAKLEFTASSTETGFLVLQKDNPSGLPENDDELRIPVRFIMSDSKLGNCFALGCALCSDNNVPPNILCDYSPTYSCYPKYSKCERQPNGRCGWTHTAETKACLNNP